MHKFFCNFKDKTFINSQTLERMGIKYPDCHTEPNLMALLAIADGTDYPFLPFCNTVEAEGLGAKINLGDIFSLPRAGEYISLSLESLENIHPFDLSKGRINVVLEACKQLRSCGKNVIVEICGAVTLLTYFMPFEKLLKYWKKEPDRLKKIFDFVISQQLYYVRELFNVGVKLVSFADPTGSFHILGEVFSKSLAVNYTVPLLKAALSSPEHSAAMHICPNNLYALERLGLVKREVLKLSRPLSYISAIFENIKDIELTGQMCIKDTKIEVDKLEFIVI